MVAGRARGALLFTVRNMGRISHCLSASRAKSYAVEQLLHDGVIGNHACLLMAFPVLANEVPGDSSAPAGQVFQGNALAYLSGMGISEQTAHDSAEAVAITDEGSGSELKGFGFGGHTSGCQGRGANLDKVFEPFSLRVLSEGVLRSYPGAVIGFPFSPISAARARGMPRGTLKVGWLTPRSGRLAKAGAVLEIEFNQGLLAREKAHLVEAHPSRVCGADLYSFTLSGDLKTQHYQSRRCLNRSRCV